MTYLGKKDPPILHKTTSVECTLTADMPVCADTLLREAEPAEIAESTALDVSFQTVDWMVSFIPNLYKN